MEDDNHDRYAPRTCASACARSLTCELDIAWRFIDASVTSEAGKSSAGLTAPAIGFIFLAGAPALAIVTLGMLWAHRRRTFALLLVVEATAGLLALSGVAVIGAPAG